MLKSGATPKLLIILSKEFAGATGQDDLTTLNSISNLSINSTSDG